MTNESTRHQADVLVIGAGPAGLAAACVAAEAGKSVIVLDSSPWLGGQIWRGEQAHPTLPQARNWFRAFEECGARLLSGTTAFAAPRHHVVLAESASGVVEVAWERLVIATGARELFVPFPGWTLPGVIGPGGLHAMGKAGWPVSGKRVVVAGTGPLLLAVADGLKQHGAHIVCIAEQAPATTVYRFGLGLLRHPAKLLQGIAVKSRLLGVPYRCGWWPLKAEGDGQIRQVTLTNGREQRTETCDYLAVGFHLIPNMEWPLLLGCATDDGCVCVGEFQETTVPDVFCAGEPTGVGGADCALVEGQIAGWAAAGRKDSALTLFGRRASWHAFRDALTKAFALRPELRGMTTADTVVCRCEDVRRRELEGCADWRAAKLHTRCGMGACQGRTCGGATRYLFGWKNESIRPPVLPVRVGALAGRGMETQQEETP